MKSGNKVRNITVLSILSYLLVFGTGCLKTRAQLREEAERPVPVQPAQDVHLQGQYAVDEIKDAVTRMEGRIQDLERGEKELQTKGGTSEELKKIEARLQQLEQNEAHILETLKAIQENPPHKDPVDIYKKAKAEYDAGHYEAAAEGFGSYAKSPKAKMAMDALFFRGESYFKLKQYKKAIIEFSKFPEKYSKSNFMPEALYKIGLSFEALGMKEDAKGFYLELVEKFPKSPQVKKVRKKLQ